MLKKDKLRYNEYYDMQHIYDELYAQSVIRQIKRCLFRQIKTGLSEHLTME